MRYLFFGTPKFSAAVLEKLIAGGIPPAGVVCNPDRPVGRKKIVTPPPTKLLAEKFSIPVYQPDNFANSKFQIPNSKFDFAVVAAYAKIIPQSALKAFPKGVIGVHPSLLPEYRGATPIQSVILAGEKETGVTLYLMDERVDHGAILISAKLPIADIDTYETLEKKLADLAGNLLMEIMPKFARGEMKPVPQDENRATFTKKLITQDGFVNLDKDDPIMIERKVRALNPEPGVWTIQQIQSKPKRVKLLEAEVIGGKLKLKKIQIEGEKPKSV
jgi:methionyl-tRNA formyltransferase